MLETIRRLLSPEYLVVSEPGPLGGLWILYLALGLLFASGLAAALWILAGPARSRRPAGARAWAWFELWVCLAGLGTVAGRFLGWPGWSARIWPYSLAALGLLAALAYLLRGIELPGWLSRQLRILAFRPLPHEPPDPARGARPAAWIAGLVLHLAGTGLVIAMRYGWPLWAAPLALLALLLPQAPLLARRRTGRPRPDLMALSPLLAAYSATALWLLYRWLDITIVGWQGLAFPDPMTSLFYVDGIVLAAVAYALLCQLHVTAQGLGRPALLWRGAAAGLLLVTLAWAGIVYLGKRTHGATASDPYAYAQMGVDLAERGTFAHRYALFEDVIPLGIAWAPLQPVGYHIPRNDLGDCPSVWATGASALLAAGYALLGEVGLYVTTPLLALLALAATGALVYEVLRPAPHGVKALTAVITVALLATSPEHVDRLLVPMADAPAQLFTVLCLLFLLRGTRHLAAGRLSALDWLLAGLSFAWAYWVRHTQLVLALPAVLGIAAVAYAGTKDKSIRHLLRSAARLLLPTILFAGDARQRPRAAGRLLLPLVLFAAAALLGALPDIVYRWRWFGGPLATETTELPLMGLQHVGPVAWQILRDALVAGEWGYLFPLALYGGYRLAQAEYSRPRALILGSAFLAVLLVHLTYHSLRLRDLISLFPLLDLAAAYGAVTLLLRARALARSRRGRLGRALLPAAAAAWIVLSLGLARWTMIDNVWKPGWASFGYMRAEHRAAFDRLAALTPPDAVVGASLNAGAVALYSGRDPIRPYDSWTVGEWGMFLDAMAGLGRPVYLLDDGGLMAEFIDQQRDRCELVPVAELQVPLFYTRGRDTGWLYHLVTCTTEDTTVRRDGFSRSTTAKAVTTNLPAADLRHCEEPRLWATKQSPTGQDEPIRQQSNLHLGQSRELLRRSQTTLAPRNDGMQVKALAADHNPLLFLDARSFSQGAAWAPRRARRTAHA